MAITKEEFLKLASTKQENFKVPSLGNAEITIRELTIAESNKINEMSREKKPIDEIIKFACKCSCVEPEFFTDEELEGLGQTGNQAILEIYMQIPLIGKTKEQIKAHKEFVEKQSKEKVKELTKEEEAKK